jgi:threonine synthase
VKLHTDRPLSWQVCLSCGNELTETDPHSRCPRCGGLLEIAHRPPDLTAPELMLRFTERRGRRAGVTPSGVWRFREVVLPSAEAVISHPEGNTPLLQRAALDRWTGAEGLLLKHEGHNPTGSFKDRGMTVGVTQAVRIGARAVACASTGNTSASLAAYAAQAGLPALVLVPAGNVATGKLAQSLAYGARTLLVRGGFDDCLRLVQEASERLGVYLLNSINPFRLEGQKTIVLELLQQLTWDPPDWIVLPAGNLGNTAAFGKALREARAWGLIDRLPRLAAVQAAGAAPFARSFEQGFRERYRVDPETVATAIRIGDPASHDRAVRAIRETDGVVLAVSDGEILEAKAAVDACGVGCEPASAASVAGVRALVRRGTIPRGARVVAVLTGHLLKDPDMLLRYHVETEPPPPGANRPVEIEADLRQVERALEQGTKERER